MFRCKLFLVLVLGVFLGNFLEGQEIIKGKGPFQLEVDYARFNLDSLQDYIELYYALHENMLTYQRRSDGYVGAANIHWSIRRDTTRIAEKLWSVPHTISDTSKLSSSQTLMGIESVGLPTGNYQMTITTVDLADTARTDSFTIPLLVSAFPSNKEALSDIEFSTSIQPSPKKESPFYKNTLEVIPNASRLYGTGLPIMYYYVEAYNLIDSSRRNSNFIVHTAVVDALGKEVLAHDKIKVPTHSSSVEMGTMNLTSLRSGTYIFKVSLLDTLKTVLAVSEKKFFVYKPGSRPDTSIMSTASDFVAGEFGAMSLQEVENAFAVARYIATQGEQQQYNKLTDLKAKQKFLAEFWRGRSSDPSSSINSVKEDFYRRVDYANTHYALALKPGWKTDRGRIYITYGPSDDIERYPSSSESNPYEIWHYNSIQGGVIFVFVDRNDLGDYALVHSTHRDEIQDENWYQDYAQKSQ